MNNIFETVKETVPVPAAAERYGLEVHGGMTHCIFHEDSNPSMKLYEDNYHCFACGAHGDVISLTAQLFSTSQLEAAKKLAYDFGISSDDCKPSVTKRIRTESEREKESRVFCTLLKYCGILREYRKRYAPRSEGEELHPLFAESLNNLERYEALFDEYTDSDKKAFIESYGKEIEYAERRINDELERTASIA